MIVIHFVKNVTSNPTESITDIQDFPFQTGILQMSTTTANMSEGANSRWKMTQNTNKWISFQQVGTSDRLHILSRNR